MAYKGIFEVVKSALSNKRTTVEGRLLRKMRRQITSDEAAAGRKKAFVVLLEKVKVKHSGRWFEIEGGRALIEKKRWRLGRDLQEGDWLRFEAMIRPVDSGIGCEFEDIENVRLPYAKTHRRAWPKHGKTKIISRRCTK